MTESFESVFLESCKRIEYLLDNCTIRINPENRFFLDVDESEIYHNYLYGRIERQKANCTDEELMRAVKSGAYDGLYDFGHTTAEWKSVISLGIFGLRERIDEYGAQHRGNKEKDEFFAHLSAVYDAIIRFTARCARFAKKQGKRKWQRDLKISQKDLPQTSTR